MNKERKAAANKGFSLVELIIVVAIMAILGTVLAPQYLKYVEKTRLQKDNTAISEIANAIKIAMADETINSKTTTPTTITIKSSEGNEGKEAKTVTFNTGSELDKELKAVIGETFTTTSNTYKTSSASIVITVNYDSTTGVKITAAGWYDTADGTATTAEKPHVF